MTIIDDYRYDLRLEGADEQTLSQFLQAFDRSDFRYLTAQDPDEPLLFSSEMLEDSGKMFEHNIEEELHTIALLFPQPKLHLVAENLDKQDYDYELICQDDLFQRADLISSLSDFSPPVPFAERQAAMHQEHIRAQKKDELLKEICTKTDFDLLHAGKEALESALQHDDRLPKEALHDLIGFLNRSLLKHSNRHLKKLILIFHPASNRKHILIFSAGKGSDHSSN